jgi:5-methylcytosine-specific restriction endonuclease McrA
MPALRGTGSRDVTGAPEPDRGAIAFAEKLMTVLAYGRKTATYKFAVLLGLIDLCHEKSSASGSAPRRVKVSELAEKVIALYWPHTTPFEHESGVVLEQNSGRRQAEIIQLIRRFRDDEVGDPSASRTRARLRRREEYDHLVRDVEWKLAEMPLPKLQRVGDQLDPFVYRIAWNDEIRRADYASEGFDRTIHFAGDAADHLVRLAPLLRPVIQREWARLVAQFNRLPEGRLEEFLFGVERVSTAAVQSGLRELQEGRCFYCGDRLGSRCDVDHFVPWVRYPDNGIENLVAADRGCNGAKRDHLAAAEHVDAWVRRIEQHKSDLAEIAARAQWERHPDRSLSVARSIYLRLPGDARLWRLERDFVTVDRPRLVRAFEGW